MRVRAVKTTEASGRPAGHPGVSRAGRRSPGGMTLSEAACALGLLTPVLLFVSLVVIEASRAYVIGTAMVNGAALAARSMAEYYRTNPEVAVTTSKQQAIFTNIRIPNMISSNSQFSIPAGGWNLTATPPRVTVVVTYLPGQGSPALPSFPSIDPLKLGSNFVISESATYALQQ